MRACEHKYIYTTTWQFLFKIVMVCLGPTSSFVVSLSLTSSVLWPIYWLVQEHSLLSSQPSTSPSSSTTSRQTPPPVEVCVCPEFHCLPCINQEESEPWIPLLLLSVLVALIGGFVLGRWYERRSAVLGRPVKQQSLSPDRLPGKNRKKVGHLS